MQINQRFSIKRVPHNFIVIEHIPVDKDNVFYKGTSSEKLKKNYFTKLEQACNWILNESIDVTGDTAIMLQSIEQAKEEILKAVSSIGKI